MTKLKVLRKDLRAMGYPEGPVISIAMNVMERYYKHHAKEKVMEILENILVSPIEYKIDAVLALIAERLISKPPTEGIEVSLNKNSIHINVFGTELVETVAMIQISQSARLRISIAGALVPDALAG